MRTFQVFVFTLICYFSVSAQSGEKLGNVSTKSNNDNPCINNPNKTCENTAGYFMASQYGYGENESFAQRNAEAKVKASLGGIFGEQIKTILVNYQDSQNQSNSIFTKEETSAIDTVLSSNVIYGFEKYCQSFNTALNERNQKIITSIYCGRVPIKLNISMLGQKLIAAGVPKKRVKKIIEILFEGFDIPFEKVGLKPFAPTLLQYQRKEFGKAIVFSFGTASVAGGFIFNNIANNYQTDAGLYNTNQKYYNDYIKYERNARTASIVFFGISAATYVCNIIDGFNKSTKKTNNKVAIYKQKVDFKSYYAPTHSGLTLSIALK